MALPVRRPFPCAPLPLLTRATANADCECGYSTPKLDFDENDIVWTELSESNFLTIQDVHADKDWRVQRYFLEPRPGAPYGRNCTDANVVSNPVPDNNTLEGDGQLGGDPGLQLWVRSGVVNGYVPSGEVKTTRTDMLYGSFRIGAKLTPVNGTCSAMFTVCSPGVIPLQVHFSGI